MATAGSVVDRGAYWDHPNLGPVVCFCVCWRRCLRHRPRTPASVAVSRAAAERCCHEAGELLQRADEPLATFATLATFAPCAPLAPFATFATLATFAPLATFATLATLASLATLAPLLPCLKGV